MSENWCVYVLKSYFFTSLIFKELEMYLLCPSNRIDICLSMTTMYYGQAFLQLAVMQLFRFQVSWKQIAHMGLYMLGTEGGHGLWGPGQAAPCQDPPLSRGSFRLLHGPAPWDPALLNPWRDPVTWSLL